ncbi:MAG TPA: PQQ-dependent sugar dehydrogenase [Thermoleophilaceae bacterium]|nr:PQQ-dependent sugar dehydrogenase [Thermoleophilaceae bacterium]
MPRQLPFIPVLLAVALAGCGGADANEEVPRPEREPATESGEARHFDVVRIEAGLNRPTFVGAAPGDTGALWVLEQPGRVVRIAPGGRRRVALDISDEVKVGGEQGLLGIAFHPDFATDRRVYLHWSDAQGDTSVAELEARADGTLDGRTRRSLLRLEQPEENHNGGQLAFGPDGRLYLGLGDGGGSFDPNETAQDLGSPLGKVASIDVDAARPRWRTELYGLRNPWRFSFDPALGELWVADVGQDETEEINRVLIEPDEPPKNLGWSAFEGTFRIHETHALDPRGELIWPVATYSHDDGCSVTGGFVYRGTALPALSGRYLYGDFCSGALWTLKPTADGFAEDVRRERATVPQLTHIGEDSDGRIVFASATGAIYRARIVEG